MRFRFFIIPKARNFAAAFTDEPNPMILKIVGYGHPALRRQNQELVPGHPGLDEMIANMFETMYNAHGVGLAAPQVDLPYRLFVVDGSPMQEDSRNGESLKDFKKVFINPRILEETGAAWNFEEGCLSIPDLREQVTRKGELRIRYFDQQFVEHIENFSGLKARIIQHEYDHIEGVLFTDRVSPLRKSVIRKRLQRISKGQVDAAYPMKFFI